MKTLILLVIILFIKGSIGSCDDLYDISEDCTRVQSNEELKTLLQEVKIIELAKHLEEIKPSDDIINDKPLPKPVKNSQPFKTDEVVLSGIMPSIIHILSGDFNSILDNKENPLVQSEFKKEEHKEDEKGYSPTLFKFKKELTEYCDLSYNVDGRTEKVSLKDMKTSLNNVRLEHCFMLDIRHSLFK